MPPPKYECPNPDKKSKSLRQTLKAMCTHPKFAEFIHNQLWLEQNGTPDEKAAATACLDSYFKAEKAEIDALCLTPEQQAAVMSCTEQHKLLSPTAWAFKA